MILELDAGYHLESEIKPIDRGSRTDQPCSIAPVPAARQFHR
jgi:hypothetical protein